MRILYIANGIPVPGTLGGSTHAYEVARGLAQRGHDVHLLAASTEGGALGLSTLTAPIAPIRPTDGLVEGFQLYHQDLPKMLTPLGAGPLNDLIERLKPDAIIERYYNFAGFGVHAGHRLGLPVLLEVNALMVDPPEVTKRRLDTLLGNPLQRRAVQQCMLADYIITPLHTTVPAEVPREKIIELPWGANVDRFASIAPHTAYTEHDAPTAVFLGSFRNWHGVVDFVRAGLRLIDQGHPYRFLLIGDGPERPQAAGIAKAQAARFKFTGRVPYTDIPEKLRYATVGVAPFTTRSHPALQSAGFYWSPLKIYEYMAASLPVVTTNIHPLNQVIRDGQEGALFTEDNIDDLANAIHRVMSDREQARRMGARARERMVLNYSWRRHCTELERLLYELRMSKNLTT